MEATCEKLERGRLSSCSPAKNKEVALTSAVSGWRQRAVFLSCHNRNRPARGLHFDSVYGLVTKLPENSSAKLICSYPSTQQHNTGLCWSQRSLCVCRWRLISLYRSHGPEQRSPSASRPRPYPDALVKWSPFHRAQLTTHGLKRRGSLALISYLKMT